MVGDPSGKREERPVMTLEQIDRNARSLARQLTRFLSFEGANAARMRNNADWLRGIPLMEFLRDTGKHFTLSYMLQKESVRSRLEVGITYTEFSYMLIRAYDFWHLYRTEHCEVWKRVYTVLEAKLLADGERPLSLDPARGEIEREMLERWMRGEHASIASILRARKPRVVEPLAFDWRREFTALRREWERTVSQELAAGSERSGVQ